jgi:hypothetical protein
MISAQILTLDNSMPLNRNAHRPDTMTLSKLTIETRSNPSLPTPPDPRSPRHPLHKDLDLSIYAQRSLNELREEPSNLIAERALVHADAILSATTHATSFEALSNVLNKVRTELTDLGGNVEATFAPLTSSSITKSSGPANKRSPPNSPESPRDHWDQLVAECDTLKNRVNRIHLIKQYVRDIDDFLRAPTLLQKAIHEAQDAVNQSARCMQMAGPGSDPESEQLRMQAEHHLTLQYTMLDDALSIATHVLQVPQRKAGTPKASMLTPTEPKVPSITGIHRLARRTSAMLCEQATPDSPLSGHGTEVNEKKSDEVMLSITRQVSQILNSSFQDHFITQLKNSNLGLPVSLRAMSYLRRISQIDSLTAETSALLDDAEDESKGQQLEETWAKIFFKAREEVPDPPCKRVNPGTSSAPPLNEALLWLDQLRTHIFNTVSHSRVLFPSVSSVVHVSCVHAMMDSALQKVRHMLFLFQNEKLYCQHDQATEAASNRDALAKHAAESALGGPALARIGCDASRLVWLGRDDVCFEGFRSAMLGSTEMARLDLDQEEDRSAEELPADHFGDPMHWAEVSNGLAMFASRTIYILNLAIGTRIPLSRLKSMVTVLCASLSEVQSMVQHDATKLKLLHGFIVPYLEQSWEKVLHHAKELAKLSPEVLPDSFFPKLILTNSKAKVDEQVS